MESNQNFDVFEDARVYGDAFIVKVKKIWDYDGRRKAVFDEMKDFGDHLGADKWNFVFTALDEMARM